MLRRHRTAASAQMADALPVELSRLLAPADPASRDAAWDGFTAAYSRLLLHTTRSLSSDHDAAMDAYAHVLEQLRTDDFRRLRSYSADGRGKFTTWLVVVVRRLCLDFRRQRYGRPRDPTPAGREEHAVRRRIADLVAEELDSGRHDTPGPGPDAAVEERERREMVAAALGQLEPQDRLLIALRFEDDLSAREIAGLIDLPTPFHVYRRLDAVLKALRDALRRRGMDGRAT